MSSRWPVALLLAALVAPSAQGGVIFGDTQPGTTGVLGQRRDRTAAAHHATPHPKMCAARPQVATAKPVKPALSCADPAMRAKR